MSQRHYIITGTSRGIGGQLALMLLQQGHAVYGIARNHSITLDRYERYTHYVYDLSDPSGLEQLMENIIRSIELADTDTLYLINNSSMLEPLGKIEQCGAAEIAKNVQITLIAPMILTSCFLNQTNRYKARRKIMNISSGSGVYPAPSMSAYCTAKAGLNMFTQCVGAEQASRENPVQIIAVNPGMVDTEMQSMARGQDEKQFELAGAFSQAFESGQLLSTAEIGEHLLRILDEEHSPGAIVNYNEVYSSKS
ncbi:SDR family NAD(P)-dependent oxidoreductase [Paenibacillus lactis]|uniref:SDR family NAD(P)-dependent oxidoreductase n=1 Tax=Paenibacillus lactis TaxID=228574 RepID=UPI003D707AFD